MAEPLHYIIDSGITFFSNAAKIQDAMREKINGLEIDYQDVGKGMPVVFIHAFPFNQIMWDDQVEFLRDSYRIITLDLRGFGKSEVPQGPYSMDQMASDVFQLIRSLGITEAVLVGLSMGGYISFAFLKQYKSTIKAMVLADTRATADPPANRERRYKAAEKAETEGVLAIFEDMVPMLLSRETIDNKPDLAAKVREIASLNSRAGVAAAQRAMAERPDSTGLLRGIAFPVLVIGGRDDGLTPPSELDKMARRIQGSKLVVIEKAGHLSNMEQPDHFNFSLKNFLDSL